MKLHSTILIPGILVIASVIQGQYLKGNQDPLPYPSYENIPVTNFDCNGRWGYFADPETGCQTFHLCQGTNKIYASFLCVNTTLFQQNPPQRCDYWYRVDCSNP
ncbi:U-scoloptoxin(01)-Er1a-like [Tachypleus tridentatus]|uniref:U-scoloptoxin(01)-Er1a-like n=1 Tax=Tachypleus tridentatus TaxID=6853 RepID=UPI003FD4411C